MEQKGFLLTIEGIDGSGKSSVARSIFAALKGGGFSVVLTKEPGGTPFGHHIRTLLQERPFALCPETEFFLFAADRAQHMGQLVAPALACGTIVISDRMADSSLAYQGFGRGLNRTMIAQVNNWALQGRMPDLTIYIKVDYKTAIERLAKRNEQVTAFEKEQQDFFERVINGFETIFKERTNVITLDGTQSLALVEQEALSHAVSALAAKGLSAEKVS